MDGLNGTPVALRIDTVTGRTWRLTDRETDDGFVATWVPIREKVPALPQGKAKSDGSHEQAH